MLLHLQYCWDLALYHWKKCYHLPLEALLHGLYFSFWAILRKYLMFLLIGWLRHLIDLFLIPALKFLPSVLHFLTQNDLAWGERMDCSDFFEILMNYLTVNLFSIFRFYCRCQRSLGPSIWQIAYIQRRKDFSKYQDRFLQVCWNVGRWILSSEKRHKLCPSRAPQTLF